MKRVLAVLIGGAALAGGTPEPTYVRPTPAVPQAWPVGAAYPTANQPALPSVSYRDVFKEPRLQALIERAIANNQDLQIALANVTIARSQYRVQRAELLPKIDANLNASEQKRQV